MSKIKSTASQHGRIELIYVFILLTITFVGLCEKYKGADHRQTDIWRHERPMKIWVKYNMAEEDKFLIPPYVNSWQSTKRPCLYDVNVINAASYNKAFMADAIEGFQALTGIDLKTITEEEMNEISPLNEDWSRRNTILDERYDNLSTERIIKLRDDYDIGYFVTSSKKIYTFPIVFRNEKFTIYDIKPTKESDNSYNSVKK